MDKRINQLIKNAELDIKANNHRKAEQKLFQALGLAYKAQNVKSANKILKLFREVGLFLTNPQSVELEPLETEGFILDIGGGGEGIIGRLNGIQVIAIDTNERELEETQNKALKIVTDATELKFLPKSFPICTAFFSLMYIPRNKHLQVFQEVYRVLKGKGRFLMWDVRIPMAEGECKEFIVPLKIQMLDEVVETGYGVKWQVQDIEYFKKLAQQVKFKVVNEWSKDEIFYLEMVKQG